MIMKIIRSKYIESPNKHFLPLARGFYEVVKAFAASSPPPSARTGEFSGGFQARSRGARRERYGLTFHTEHRPRNISVSVLMKKRESHQITTGREKREEKKGKNTARRRRREYSRRYDLIKLSFRLHLSPRQPRRM